MKPTSKTLSWAFVIILLAVGIFTGLGVILMHKQQLVLQGQAEATEIRISGKLPGRIDTFFVQEGDWYTKEILLSLLIALKYMPSINK